MLNFVASNANTFLCRTNHILSKIIPTVIVLAYMSLVTLNCLVFFNLQSIVKKHNLIAGRSAQRWCSLDVRRAIVARPHKRSLQVRMSAWQLPCRAEREVVSGLSRERESGKKSRLGLVMACKRF